VGARRSAHSAGEKSFKLPGNRTQILSHLVCLCSEYFSACKIYGDLFFIIICTGL